MRTAVLAAGLLLLAACARHYTYTTDDGRRCFNACQRGRYQCRQSCARDDPWCHGFCRRDEAHCMDTCPGLTRD